MRPLHRTDIVSLAAPRDGVIDARAIVAAGGRPELASREHAAGRWQRLLPGIYLTEPGLPTLRQRCHAAVLHAGSNAVITANAGCLLRKVPGARPDDLEVTVLVPRGVRRVTSAFCTVIVVHELPQTQVLQRQGVEDLPVADLARCVADAIRRPRDLDTARAVGMSALRSPELDWASVVQASHRRGPGAGHLRRVVRDIGDGARSPAEADVHDALSRAASRGALPPYLLNPDVYVDDVLLGSPDAWFVGYGLGDEVDSRAWHGAEDQLDATLLRHERFAGAGLYLNHTTPSRFADSPAAHVAKLRTLVRQRRALDTPEPAGLRVLGRGPLLPARSPWPQVEARRWR